MKLHSRLKGLVSLFFVVTMAWVQITTVGPLPRPRNGHSFTVIGGERGVILFGGSSPDEGPMGCLHQLIVSCSGVGVCYVFGWVGGGIVCHKFSRAGGWGGSIYLLNHKAHVNANPAVLDYF